VPKTHDGDSVGKGQHVGGEINVRHAETQLGVTFSNHALLVQALTHGSYANECTSEDTEDNQRLEFLGDAILDMLVGAWLYRRYPDATEGELTSLRARIVRTHGLAAFAREVGLGDLLRLGRGEATSGGQRRAANLCAAFEAVVGAVYVDRGFAAAQEWVTSFLDRHSEDIDAQRQSKDAKSRLQEYTQRHLHVTPVYRLVQAVGPDHARVFTSQASINERVWGQGTGTTKQAAEQAAAQVALSALMADGDESECSS